MPANEERFCVLHDVLTCSSTAGTSQAYVYTSEAPFMTTVEPLTVAAATEHAAPVGVALVSNQAGLHAPGHGNEPSLVSVTNAPTGTVIATSASASIASTTNLSKADHSTVPTAAITNAQIVTARACPATVSFLYTPVLIFFVVVLDSILAAHRV